MRFRKSIRITKGIRLNLSKTGVSLTAGMRGASINVGQRGTYFNIGIPGTGFYDRIRLDKASRGYAPEHTRSPQLVELHIRIFVDDDGKVSIQDVDGNPITDDSLIRKIKRTDEYKAKVEELLAKKKEEIDRATENFIGLYKFTPALIAREDVQRELDQLKPNEYKIKEFNVPKPGENDFLSELEVEAIRNVRSFAFW